MKKTNRGHPTSIRHPPLNNYSPRQNCKFCRGQKVDKLRNRRCVYYHRRSQIRRCGPPFLDSPYNQGFYLKAVSALRENLEFLELKCSVLPRNRMLCSLAMDSPLSFETIRLSSMSHLLPRIIFSTSSFACSSMFLSHFAMLSNVFGCVMSYTSMIPIAPD